MVTNRAINDHDNGDRTYSFDLRVPGGANPTSCLDAERAIQAVLHEAGVNMMENTLSSFDTSGEPIRLGTGRGETTWTSKGQSPGAYQSTFGQLNILRHVYQSSAGGATYCPLEDLARIIENSTPQFASLVSSKYAIMSGRETKQDLAITLGRELTLANIQNIATTVGDIALAKEPYWNYEAQTPTPEVAAIAMGIDGTCTPICDEGYRQSMVGSIDLLDAEGERLETIYIANAPEEGKTTFFQRIEREVDRLKLQYPKPRWIGLSDGAKDLQEWLAGQCGDVILDFYHASEYVVKVAAIIEPGPKSQEWLEKTLHELKHTENSAEQLHRDLIDCHERLFPAQETQPPTGDQEGRSGTLQDEAILMSTIGYIGANLHRMNYAQMRNANLPIGSGVTEAACKRVIKARTGGSGMRWKRKTLQSLLAARSLVKSSNRWSEFWSRISRFGY